MDLASKMLSEAMSQSQIRGVYIPPIDTEVMHFIYVDDVSIVFRANPLFVQCLMEIFQRFGRVSGLYVIWSKTNAAFISPHSRPRRFDHLGWSWETEENATKLLGFPIAKRVSVNQMSSLLLTNLQKNLEKSRKNPALLAARRTIANHMVMASMWYLLTLWAGKQAEMGNMQLKIHNFL
jgi:hypothetical protein